MTDRRTEIDQRPVLLDSTVLIDHLNGIRAATEYLRGVTTTAAVSAITRAEVLSGYPDGDHAGVARMMDAFHFLPIDAAAADLAARLRHRHRWRLPDALQAALAQLHGLKLATRNTRDFPPRRHRFVTVPYRIEEADSPSRP